MEPGFNLTPMLDMIFYLLFFFIMATKVRDDASQGLDVRLPSAKSARTVQMEPSPALTLTAEGQVLFKDRPVTRPQLELELRGLMSKGQYDIVIRGDERVSFGRVIELMDWCKLAGMKTAMWEMRPADAAGAAGAGK